MTLDALSERVNGELRDIGYIAAAGAIERYAALIRDLEADRQRLLKKAQRLDDVLAGRQDDLSKQAL